MANSKKYDVAVIGACGHVGLPLSISFANEGLNVIGIDINKKGIEIVKSKKMPFYEEGAIELLKKVYDKKFWVTDDFTQIRYAQYIIITAGTPVDKDLNADLSQIEEVLKSLLPNLVEGQTIILRSTLAPNTTQFIRNYIENNTKFKIGSDVFLAFAPERIAEGHAIKELKTLPQMIGTFDELSFKKTSDLIKVFTKKIVKLTPLEAELAKLFTNNYRFITFAIANEYFMIAHTLGANIYNIINAVNYDYPRANIPKFGFAKGPCLGKDSWLLVNSAPTFNSATGVISSAYRINDGLPYFLIGLIKDKIDISKKKFAVLGLTFKKDSDDERDSLSYKLIKILKNEFIYVETHDPFIDNKDIKKVLNGVDVVIIAMDHTYYSKVEFKKIVKDDTLIMDVWNLLGKKKLMIYGSELKNP